MRIGCLDVTRGPEDVVTLRNARAGHPEITLTPRQWDEFLSAAASYALGLRELPPAPRTLPLESVLSVRLM
jgi:hypothetical protein